MTDDRAYPPSGEGEPYGGAHGRPGHDAGYGYPPARAEAPAPADGSPDGSADYGRAPDGYDPNTGRAPYYGSGDVYGGGPLPETGAPLPYGGPEPARPPYGDPSAPGAQPLSYGVPEPGPATYEGGSGAFHGGPNTPGAGGPAPYGEPESGQSSYGGGSGPYGGPGAGEASYGGGSGSYGGGSGSYGGPSAAGGGQAASYGGPEAGQAPYGAGSGSYGSGSGSYGGPSAAGGGQAASYGGPEAGQAPYGGGDLYGDGQQQGPYYGGGAGGGGYGGVPEAGAQQQPYGDHGPAQGGGYDGYAASPPQGGAYVPEPLPAAMPPQHEPGAAYTAPAAGGEWGSGQQPGSGGGHAPVPGDTAGWGAAPAAAPAWAGGPAGTGEHAGADPYGAARPQSHPQSQPHPYGGGVEQTAVMPVIEDAAEDDTAHAEQPGRPGRTAQAPARTGSPIIAPGIQPAALTAALGLLTAGGAAIGKPGLAVLLVLLQAVTAAGWFRLNGMWPARQGIVLAFLAGVTADIGLLVADGDHGPAVLVGTLGVWLLFVLVLQLRHHGSADERLSSLTATSASTLLTVLAAGYLAVATASPGTDPVIVGTVAVAVAALVRALPLPGAAASIGASLLVAAASGLVTAGATGLGAGDGVLIAAAAGACALIGLRVASYDFPSRFVHFTAGVALPLTAAAPVVYVLGRALG